MTNLRSCLACLLVVPFVAGAFLACSSDGGSTGGIDAGPPGQVDGGVPPTTPPGVPPTTPPTTPPAADAGKILADGLIDPIPYLSIADSPFQGVAFPQYYHFEDFEDGVLDQPGVTASSTTLSSSFGPALIDSVDGDDGVIDGKCEKPGGTCNALFANGTVDFTFDAAALGGALPTHVGIVWTDGATGCDAVFEAYDSTDTLIGTKTATAVGDNNNTGGTAEDRFFGVVHAAGVKKIVVKSSAGGVEVDHLQYGH